MVEKSGKIIVLGKGFLGSQFERRGYEVWGKDKFELPYNMLFTNKHKIKLDKYNIIINCIGTANTRKCESRDDFPEALWSNSDVPRILSGYCYAQGKRFVHVSTGCLYDSGDKINKEDSFMAAHCNYTVTKWMGEMALHADDLVLRPRLFFGDVDHPNNLLTKLKRFKYFLDADNSYSSTDVIVDAAIALIDNMQSGIFNVACDGHATVKQLAEMVGLSGGIITEEELHAKEGLFLVHNIMSIDKLKQFYTPPKLEDEIKRCWGAIK